MDNDSDFEIEEETTPQKKAHNGRIIKEDPSLHQKRPVGKVDPGAANGKPGKARRNGEYRYHVNLTDLEKWEEEVNALEQPPANGMFLLGSHSTTGVYQQHDSASVKGNLHKFLCYWR